MQHNQTSQPSNQHPIKKSLKKSYPLIIIILLATIISSYFSIVLLNEHYNRDQHGWVASSICGSQGSAFDCRKIENTPIAVIFGIPLAAFGLFFFVTMFLVVLIWLFQSQKNYQRTLGFLFLSFFFASVFDLLLMVYGLVSVQALCPLCFITYLCVWFSLVALWYYYRKGKAIDTSNKNPFSILFKDDFSGVSMLRLLFSVLILIIAFLFSGFTNSYIYSESKLKQARKNPDQEKILRQILSKYASQPELPVTWTDNPWYGSENAPITILEFSDFMCPFCGQTAPILKKIVDDNPGKVRLKFLNYPLDNSCNYGMSRQMHVGACELAQAVICAGKQQKFWQYHDTIFSKKLTKANNETVLKIGKEVNLNMEKFGQCLADPNSMKQVSAELKIGDTLGVKGTPAIYINSKKYNASVHPVILQEIIDYHINEQNVKP